VKTIRNILSKYNISDFEEFIYIEIDASGEVYSLELFDGDYFDFPAIDKLAEIVSNFKRLKTLNIEFFKKNIKDLSFLSSLKELEVIHIECDTTVTDLDWLEGLSSLKSLFIQSSQVDQINCLSKNKKLESIGLINSNIEDISVLAELKHLKFINFSFNSIQEINVLKHHKKLEKVFLSNNAIESIDPLNDCETLTWVNIANNNISDLSPISNSKKLQYLTIANNQIKAAKLLDECSDLFHLDISNNLIDNIDFLDGKEKLCDLMISNNPLLSVEVLQELKSLRRLNASNLNNVVFKKSFKFKSMISFLDLSNCNLTNASFLSNQHHLVNLNLSDNCISDFKFLKNCCALKNLSVKNNNLTIAFPSFYFSKIDGIDLRGNAFGGKLFERRPGATRSYWHFFYKINPKDQIEKGVLKDLEKLVIDFYQENNYYDAALVYYYFDTRPPKEKRSVAKPPKESKRDDLWIPIYWAIIFIGIMIILLLL